MKTHLKWFAAGIMMITATAVSGQNSQVLYHMNLPQNHLLNPSLRHTGAVYVGLPALTGINFSMANNFLRFEDIFTDGRPLEENYMPFLNPDFDTEKFLSRLKERNYLETGTAVQLLGVGFAAGKGNYFFLDIIERVECNIVFPKDLLRLAFLGNENFVGQSFDLSAFRTHINYFREAGIGFSRNITPNLRIGVKGKMYMGLATASVDNKLLKVQVNNDLTNSLSADMSVNISGPVRVYTDAQNKIDDVEFDDNRFGSGEFFTNTGNIGFGIDLGAEYYLTDRISLSAALTDFGYIKWKSDLTSLSTKADITLNGMTIADVQSGSATFEDVLKGVLDSIAGETYLMDPGMFRTNIPVGITVGGKFELNDMISFGALSHSRIIEKQIREAFTLSANLNLRNFFSASLAYTAGNQTYDNLGIGLAIRGGWAQFYLLVDRIPLSWKNVTVDGDKIPVPANWNTVNTSFGVNLLFGNRMKRDQPVL